MKKLILIAVSIVLTYSAYSQNRLYGERATLTQYYLTPYLMNPAESGQGEQAELMFNYRSAWTGFDGAPTTFAGAIDAPLGNRIGATAIIMADNFASFETFKGGVQFSYTIDMPDNRVSFGIGGDYVKHQLPGSIFMDNGEFIDAEDAIVLQAIDGRGFFDANIGIAGLYAGKLSYGIALPSIINSKISGADIDNDISTDMAFIANVGYRMEIPDKDFAFTPSVYVKQLNLVPLHVDINLLASFYGDQLKGGFTYTVGAENRLGFLVGVDVQNLAFSYSYNASTNDFQSYNNGSHEIGVRFRFNALSNNATE